MVSTGTTRGTAPTRRVGPHLAAIVPVLSIAALWLAVAVAPVLADGGPHVANTSNGSLTMTADSCAGCHRAHTAQGPYLIKTSSVDLLCLSCHGSAGAGATTDVSLGIQFRSAGDVGSPGQDPSDVSAVAGALRGGGFVNARIGSGSAATAADRPTRISYPKWDGTQSRLETWFSEFVPVLPAGQPATSGHLKVDGAAGVVPTNSLWGNGPLGSSNTGPIVALECTACHNPHGNGSYRILNPVPSPTVVSGVFTPVADPGIKVTDAPLPSPGQTRNYTVIETALVSGVGSDPTAGDYWRLFSPWDGVPTYDPSNPDADSHGIVPGSGISGDQPPGLTTSQATAWRGQITAWCSACHTRYAAPRSAATNDSGDSVYAYRHQTNQTECTQCHVAHGSNAVMDGAYASTYAYPAEPGDPALSGPSSRLLKLDNRGTCEACHDPTGTIEFTGVVGNP